MVNEGECPDGLIPTGVTFPLLDDGGWPDGASSPLLDIGAELPAAVPPDPRASAADNKEVAGVAVPAARLFWLQIILNKLLNK